MRIAKRICNWGGHARAQSIFFFLLASVAFGSSAVSARAIAPPRYLFQSNSCEYTNGQPRWVWGAWMSCGKIQGVRSKDRLPTAPDKLDGIQITDSDLPAGYLSNSSLAGAVISRTRVPGMSRAPSLSVDKSLWQKVDLNHAQFIGSQATQSTWLESDLSFSVWTSTTLKKSHFLDTNLTGADLTRTDLSDSKLVRVNLSLVTLDGANLRGADLKQTNLEEAQSLLGAIFDDTTQLPFSCTHARQVGMKYGGGNPFYCDATPPIAVPLGIPGVTVLYRAETREAFSIQTDLISLAPGSSGRVTHIWPYFGFLQNEWPDYLCAVLSALCLKNRGATLARYSPVTPKHSSIEKGLVFYSAPAETIEEEGRAHLASFFELKDDGLTREWAGFRPSAAALEGFASWAAQQGDAHSETVTWHELSLLELAQEIVLDAHWLDQNPKTTQMNCGKRRMDSTRPDPWRCSLQVVYEAPPQSPRGWFRRLTDSLQKQAQLLTGTLRLRLHPNVQAALGGNAGVVVPVHELVFESVAQVTECPGENGCVDLPVFRARLP